MTRPIFLAYPAQSQNPACRCASILTGMCKHGHMLQCHAPYTCEEAGCLRMVGNGFSFESFYQAQDEARERIRAGQMWPYRLDEHDQVYVDLNWYRLGRGSAMPGTLIESGPEPTQADA